jgi:xylulokinase
VAFSIANCLDAIQAIAQHQGTQVNVLRTGKSGGSQLSVWRQIIVDALDHDLEVSDVDEPGCLGAALLAGVGTGLYKDLGAAVQQTVRSAARTSPDPAAAAIYCEQRSTFNKTFRALEPLLYQ